MAKLKCFRCGKDISEDNWEVILKHAVDKNNKQTAPSYFYLCDDCRLIWMIAMGKWLSTGHGFEAKLALDKDKEKENGNTAQT